MPFFQSLLCFKGVDNRQRYLSLTAGFYFCFMLLTAMSTSSLSFSLIVLLFFFCLTTLSTLRRIKDAKLNSKWLIGSSVAFLVTGATIIFTESANFYWLMLLPSSVSALLLTYPSKGKYKYILGYSGPINLSLYVESNHLQHHRIEPKLVGSHSSDIIDNDLVKNASEESILLNAHQNQAEMDQSADLGEFIRNTILSKKKHIIIVLFLMTIVLMTLLIFNNSTIKKEEVIDLNEPQKIQSLTIEKLHEIILPDNFSIWLSPYSGLIVNWQANATDKQKIWSLTTAKGDTDCQEIVFNNGKKYRTLSVVIEDEIQRYAQFSPVDTKALVQDIAFRGNFELCGYTFSLKGSQAALGKNPAYAQWVDY